MLRSATDCGFIDIRSPIGLEPLRYYFVREEVHKNKVEATFSCITELLQLSLASHEKATTAFEECLTDFKSSADKTIEDIKGLNKKHGEIIDKFIEKPCEPMVLTKITSEALSFVLGLVYNRNIEEVKDLNIYTPWTPQVYGETSFDFVLKIIEELKIGENDTFLDLGSGVGNVVIQVSALCFCKKTVGIEIVEARSTFAQKMDGEFRELMKWLGHKYGQYELKGADFLDHREIFEQTNVIFCNNYAFTPELNLKLKTIFADLPDKVRILVSKSLTDEKFRINEKTANDTSAVLPVRATFKGKVSWTDVDVTFYLHEVDRTTLDRFLKAREDPELRLKFEEEQRQGKPKYYESSSEPESQENQEKERSDFETTEDEEDFVPKRGCTTRSQWQKKAAKARRPLRRERESEESDTQDESRSSAVTEQPSEASTERTRSIPSQDSSKKGVKRKRGRPPVKNNATRSAPSSSGSSAKGALQALYKHTLAGFKEVDRSAQPGCVPETIEIAETKDELPIEFRTCLKNMEEAMYAYIKNTRHVGFPAQVAQQAQFDKLKIKRLEDQCGTLTKEVCALRRYCKSQMETIFCSLAWPLPKVAEELGKTSRNMLQSKELLKHRHDTLKDDIYWLANAHQATKTHVDAFGGVQKNSARTTVSAPAHSITPTAQRTTSAQNDRGGNFALPEVVLPLKQGASPANHQGASAANHRNEKHSQGPPPKLYSGQPEQKHFSGQPEQKPFSGQPEHPKHISKNYSPGGTDVMDLSRSRKESSGKTSVKSPRQATSESPVIRNRNDTHGQATNTHGPTPDPTFLGALGRVIETSLTSTPGTPLQKPSSKSSSSRGAVSSMRNEGNLRGLSPNICTEREKLVHPSNPSGQMYSRTESSAAGGTAYLVPAEQVAQMNRNYANLMSSAGAFPGMINGNQYPFAQSPDGMMFNIYPSGPTGYNQASVPAEYIKHQRGNAGQVVNAQQMMAAPGWMQFPGGGGIFDPAQIAASVSASFCAVPGTRRDSSGGNNMAPSGNFCGFETISPPPQLPL